MAFDPTKPTIDQTRSDAIDSIRNNFAAIASTPAPVAPGRNYLTDGAGMVAQSAAGNFGGLGAGTLIYGTVDSWKCGAIAGTFSVGIPAQISTAGFGRTGYALQMTASGSGSAPWQLRMRTFIESKNAVALKGINASFSALVAHSFVTASNPTVNFQITISKATAPDNFAALTQIAQSVPVNVATGNTSPTLISLLNVAMGDTTNGVCVDVDVFIPTGPTFSTRTVRMAEAVLCEGAAATFPYEEFSTVLRRCQRFYQKSFPYATAPTTGMGTNGAMTYLVTNGGANFAAVGLRYATPMRVNPTLTFYNPSSGNGNWYNNNIPADSGVPTVQRPGDQGALVVNQQVAADALNHTVSVHWTADARF